MTVRYQYRVFPKVLIACSQHVIYDNERQKEKQKQWREWQLRADHIHCTKNPEEVENKIFVEIKWQYGQCDKKKFILNVVKYAENLENLNK